MPRPRMGPLAGARYRSFKRRGARRKSIPGRIRERKKTPGPSHRRGRGAPNGAASPEMTPDPEPLQCDVFGVGVRLMNFRSYVYLAIRRSEPVPQDVAGIFRHFGAELRRAFRSRSRKVPDARGALDEPEGLDRIGPDRGNLAAPVSRGDLRIGCSEILTGFPPTNTKRDARLTSTGSSRSSRAAGSSIHRSGPGRIGSDGGMDMHSDVVAYELRRPVRMRPLLVHPDHVCMDGRPPRPPEGTARAADGDPAAADFTAAATMGMSNGSKEAAIARWCRSSTTRP